MQVLSIFATPLASTTIDFDLNRTLNYLKSVPFEYVNDRSCEYSVSKRLLTDPFFSDIVTQINHEAALYASEVMAYNVKHSDYTIEMKTSWSIKMKPGDYAGSHYHSQSLFTGILYLDVNNSNQVVLQSPHGKFNSFAEVPLTKATMFNDNNHKVTPQAQTLVLFPSHLSHYAENNQSDKTLYYLIMDFSVKGTLWKNQCSEMTFTW